MNGPVLVSDETRRKLGEHAHKLSQQRGKVVEYGEVIEWLLEVEEAHYGQLH